MVRLTEDMVAARAKTSDMESVMKLNFWGSDLTDISIVRQFKRAEILSFSLNQITTMADFQFCVSLCELCIRRNAIKDLREVCYLQQLPRLKRLLMTENPCCDTAGDLYRPTVLRALPNLETLDNLQVTDLERENARLYGLILEHPMQRKEKEKQMTAGNRVYEGPEDIPAPTDRPASRGPRTYEQNGNVRTTESPSDVDLTHNLTLSNGRMYGGRSLTANQKSAAALLLHCVDSEETTLVSNNAFHQNQIQIRAITVPQNHHSNLLCGSGTGSGSGSGKASASPSISLQQQRKCASPILEYYRHEMSYSCDRRRGQGQVACQSQSQGHGQDLPGRNSVSVSDHPQKQVSKTVNHILGQSQSHGQGQSQGHPQHGQYQYRPMSATLPAPVSLSSSPLPRKNNNIVAAILSLITDLDVDSLDLIELALKRKRNESFY